MIHLQKQFPSVWLLMLGLVLMNSCVEVSTTENSPTIIQDDLARYVNPLIGTKNMGHTFPGAVVPFGMVQLSPQTNLQPMLVDGKYNKDTYKYCAGYQYEDSTIFGFAHTHFSGTGHSDLGDFLLMPTTGKLQLEPGNHPEPEGGYPSSFSHESEKASPGYYSVFLEDYQIQAELSTTERVGFHQYTFQETGTAHLIFDLMHNIYHYEDKNTWTFIRVENDTLITGYRQTRGWARTRTVYFAMKFSKPISSYGHKKYEEIPYNGFYRRFDESQNFPEMAGKEIRAWFDFQMEADEKLKVKFALSSVSTAGALNNLNQEIPHWNFNSVKKEAREKWNTELNKVKVQMLTKEQMETFYTALYHTLLSPHIYEDVDGKYRGLDQNIHTSKGFTNYTVFSLWDTFRALHPLFNLIQPSRNADMVKSMLAHYDQSVHKALPIWSHYANENWCMIGYHSVSVIADAFVKGNTAFNTKEALNACINSSNLNYYDGIGDFIQFGYVPADKQGSSVSKTLEFSYDDWCIAQMAAGQNKPEIEQEYLKRSESYQNHFDDESGFMRPKYKNGEWVQEFDPLDTHGQGFIEGNAWTYSLFVPHNIENMIQLMGAKEAFEQRLDSLFTMELADKYIEKNEDITRDGIIGNYVHGNEPGHHIPFLYNWTGSPWKTQSRVRMIMNTMYGNGEDGLCGNDDAGQISAWYVFSALGFYPVCPGSDRYSIGSPLVEEATLLFENGKKLQIIVENQSKSNVYIQQIVVDGKEWDKNYFTHAQLSNGNKIVFQLGSRPAFSK